MKYLSNFEAIDWRERTKETIARYKAAMTILKKEEAIDYIINHCSEWLDNPVKIIRGLDSDDKIKYFHSNPVERYSRDNANFYNLIMDNDPVWKDYPKRSKGFSCSLWELDLGRHAFLVIPEDGAKWGIAPTGDIFQSFRPQIKKLIEYSWDIDKFFRELEQAAEKMGVELDDTDYEEFRDDIRELQKKSEGQYVSFITNKLKSRKGDWWRMILNTLHPGKNGFQLMTTPELCDAVIEKKMNKQVEIWTDSPCVFIKQDDYIDFFVDVDNEADSDTMSVLKKSKPKPW